LKKTGKSSLNFPQIDCDTANLKKQMRELLIGIDSGTQSTKARVVDANTGKVLGTGMGKHEMIPRLPPGAKEQHPENFGAKPPPQRSRRH
jgi:hypothetical protein